MKKQWLLLSIIFFCSFSVPTNAQILGGLKGGVGVAALNSVGSGNDLAFNYKPGFTMPYAAFLEWRFAKAFSVQVEVGHVLAGGVKSGIYLMQSPATVSGPRAKPRYTDCLGETRLYYLTSALLMKYSHPITPNCKAYLAVGGSPAMLLSAQEASIGDGNLYERSEGGYRLVEKDKYFSETNTATADYRSWNWSVNGAMGCRWEMDREFVLIELSASKGITAVQKSTINGRNTTALYAVSVGYGFRL